MRFEVAIAGGGPAGLALAIGAARLGLSAVVLERGSYPVDKACGEGLMPRGAAELERLGVAARLSPGDASVLTGIRYVQEDGTAAEADFPRGERGLGVRRVALSAAMLEAARDAGAEVREGCAVRGHRRLRDRVELSTDAGQLDAELLVAADGLSSRIRRQEGLDLRPDLPPRFGLRRHFRVRPWTSRVEVHFSGGVEAYVTPSGERRVGIAFLWQDPLRPSGADPRVSFDRLLSRFPALAARIAGCEPDSPPRGAGPLARAARAHVLDRLALLGDAAGYVDALTGEGLTLSLLCARALAELLPRALARGASAQALAPYEREFARHFAPYERLTRALLFLSRHPELRRGAVAALARAPGIFGALLRLVA